MGLGSTLSNALAGMNASQRGIEVLSRNVANAGMPGYHRQALVVTDTAFGTSAQVRVSGLDRAFNEALQKQHTSAISLASYHATRTNYLDRLQSYMGMPGDGHSLDTLYSGFENALQALATNPDDLTTRAGVLNAAQSLVEQLNTLSGAVRELSRETEHQTANTVSELNRKLNQLADVNIRILDQSQDQGARLALMDERDRLVAQVSEHLDVKTTYRPDGTVALMTDSGVGVLDVKPSQLEFDPGGTLRLVTPSGNRLDLESGGLLSSGTLAGLLEIRGTTLVNMQDQLDEIAAGLALAMNSAPVAGTAIEPDPDIPGDPGGFSLDLSEIKPGNSVLVSYTDASGTHSVRLVHSEDGTRPNSPNAAGERVHALDLNDPAQVAGLGAALGTDVAFELDGDTLKVLDDGSGTTSVDALDGHMSGQGLGLNLFVDTHNRDFTNSLDGAGQKSGFAGRISLNDEIIADSSLLVKYAEGVSMGDPDRPNHLIDNLKTMRFVSEKMTDIKDGGVRLSGRLGEMVGQMINYQGNTVSRAQSQAQSSVMTLETINTRMENEYGVNVDEEMARLMQLQNAYAASARVVSTVQELIDSLLRM